MTNDDLRDMNTDRAIDAIRVLLQSLNASTSMRINELRMTWIDTTSINKKSATIVNIHIDADV